MNRAREGEANHSQEKPKYVLRLFVSGTTARSAAAIQNLKLICEKYLQGRYDLNVIDIYQQPRLALEEQIVAVPTLIKKTPGALRRIIGDLSDVEKVLTGKDLKPRPAT